MAYEFEDGSELKLLRSSVREFAEKEIAPRAHELDEKEEFSIELTRKMGELGLFGTIVSPDYNGQGMDYLSYIVAVEELARVDGSQAATIAAHNSLGAGHGAITVFKRPRYWMEMSAMLKSVILLPGDILKLPGLLFNKS